MTRFSILTAGDHVSKQELEITIQSFSKFFHSLTKKHQSYIQLIVFANKSNTPIILNIATRCRVFNAIKVIPLQNKSVVETAFTEASLLFLTTFHGLDNLIPKAFSHGVPILSYENSLEEHLIDNTCGLSVTFQSEEQRIDDFCQILKMLYFDPEVQKILKRGAFKKFRNTIQWKALEPIEHRLSMAS